MTPHKTLISDGLEIPFNARVVVIKIPSGTPIQNQTGTPDQ